MGLAERQLAAHGTAEDSEAAASQQRTGGRARRERLEAQLASLEAINQVIIDFINIIAIGKDTVSNAAYSISCEVLKNIILDYICLSDISISESI